MTYDTINNAQTTRATELGRIDQYEILRELGGGGFGTVFLAKDTTSGIAVAVKGLPPFVRNSTEEVANIRRNFAMVSRLTHENIAKALVLHPAKDVCYFDKRTRELLRVESGDTLMVMDYAPGVTLSKLREESQDGTIPFDSAVDILSQIASALDYAHGRNIIHRDIKPANVMVKEKSDGGFSVQVLDFGLAAEIRSSMSRVSMQIADTSGTRPYMAPEQWQGHRQGPATDQYALAAMACELLTGEVPFKSAFDTGITDVMKDAVTGDEADIGGNLPSSAVKALKRALSKKPEERFATCSDFVDALCGKKVLARSSRGWPWVVLLAVALAAGCGVYALHVYNVRREAERKEALRIEDERKEALRLEEERQEKLRIEEREAERRLKDAARDLKNRATIARDDAVKRGYNNIPEMAVLYREFERNLNSGMEAFKAGEYASATSFFERVGASMHALVAEKKRIDDEQEHRRLEEERRARLAEVDRLVGLGWQREQGTNGEDVAVWRPNVVHWTSKLLVTGQEPGTWCATKPGYEWNGATGSVADVVWKSSISHPQHPHWFSGDKEDHWLREPGYVPKDGDSNLFAVLEWKPGVLYGKTGSEYRSGEKEGTWQRKTECSACGGNGEIVKPAQCGNCSGSGRVSVMLQCSSCGGSGSRTKREQCNQCGGAGICASICSSCGGSGRLRCGTCSGNGRVVNLGGALGLINRKHNLLSSQPVYVLCRICSGRGIVSCNSCNGGGRIQSKCSTCSGNGQISKSVACGACNGSGSRSGTESCQACGGTGSKSVKSRCQTCDGTRFIWQDVQRPDDVLGMPKRKTGKAR